MLWVSYKSLHSHKYNGHEEAYKQFIDNQSLKIKSNLSSQTVILFDEQINYGRQLSQAIKSLSDIGVKTLPFVLYAVVCEDKYEPYMLLVNGNVSKSKMGGRKYYFNPSYPNSLFERSSKVESIRLGAYTDIYKTAYGNRINKFFYKDFSGIFSKSFENNNVIVEGGGSLTILMKFYREIYQMY